MCFFFLWKSFAQLISILILCRRDKSIDDSWLFTCNTDGKRRKRRKRQVKQNERRNLTITAARTKEKEGKISMDLIRTYIFHRQIVLPTLTRRKRKEK